MDSSSPLLSKSNSLILKGGGIIMMLIHHLFFIQNGLYDDVHLFRDHYLVQEIGIFCKLCVALFVFLSGYGLMISHKDKEMDPLKFYKHRFKKLYFNYWFIWLIFVPIGVFVFHRTFSEVYGSHVLLKAGLEFLGIYNLFGGLGYNPTWWFYSCIIVLYLLFPFLGKINREWPYMFASVVIVLPLFAFLPVIRSFASYLLPFVAGIWMASMPRETFGGISLGQIVITLFGLALVRNFSNSLTPVVDTLLCVGLALFVSKIKAPIWLNKVFESLGKHSMNIFLFHTFIYGYWFSDFIYATRNPLVIFVELMVICYILSVAIEYVKHKIGFYKVIA